MSFKQPTLLEHPETGELYTYKQISQLTGVSFNTVIQRDKARTNKGSWTLREIFGLDKHIPIRTNDLSKRDSTRRIDKRLFKTTEDHCPKRELEKRARLIALKMGILV